MAKVITLGEIMLRLSTPRNEKLIQAKSLDMCFGGGEANVAVSLANFGYESEFVTKLVDNPLGDCVIAELKKMNVITKNIVRGGDRLGLYFLETGGMIRPSNVVYDRANSSIADANVDEFDFYKIFDGCDWFHFSGITPAISDKASLIVKKACQVAKEKKIKISCDLNYRKKLWSINKARSVMTDLMQYVDVCIGGREDAIKVLGCVLDNTNTHDDTPDIKAYEKMFRQMVDKFDFECVVSTLRQSYTASNNDWSACAYSKKEDKFYKAKKYKLTPIFDRVGAGDAFSAGFISGMLDKKDLKNSLEFATAASALKHSILGDFNLVSKKEVENLLITGTSARVQR